MSAHESPGIHDESEPPSKKRKVRRTTRACDFCHRRGIRCTTSASAPERCQNCVDFEEPCTYHRPAKKRGIRKDSDNVSSPEEVLHRSPVAARDGRASGDAEEWKPPATPEAALVDSLLGIYFEIVYPIFPLFHWPTHLQRISRREYTTSRSFYASTMAMCALASARARDGASFSSQYGLQEQNPQSPSETFQQLAESAIPKDFQAARGLDFMRACALLALTSIQLGDISGMHKHLGAYHALVAMDGLHDETRWPKGLSLVELEERRRLFWSTYTLDIFTSIAWSGVPRSRESQCSVLYPCEMDDDDILPSGYNLAVSSCIPPPGLPTASFSTIGSPNWLRGWNFTTDLYRILEHALDHFRRRRLKQRMPSPFRAYSDEFPLQNSVMDTVMSMYAQLPQRFKETRPVTADPTEDRYSFQSANIVATLQLLRMVLFAAEDSTVEQKCRVSGELLDSLARVPLEYLRAISAPLVYHIAGIGSILGSVIEGPLSEPSYAQVRTVLLAMADLLSGLELSLHFTAGASEWLRAHVERIDEYMQTARRQQGMQHQNQHQAVAQAPYANAASSSMGGSNAGTQQSQIVGAMSSAMGDRAVRGKFSSGLLGPGDRIIVDTSGMMGPPAAESASASVEADPGLLDLGGQFEFQIPPELLEDWPWPFDLGRTLV
ncbi:hypothetical protein CONLIGDRAFT_676756 [Coniochaeta ligniaria NRRL 30616]|uniref:Zn(2)-C6 fungal-type domain-containing protein n=1 Tax=Coniochaeta ligniaria NRRL 30616 TaxID=1408157 RepID=A0A1J7J0L1_9PEZI|nr:hypothetical protein CONLIGDRAFT_676756 [Coniochaeta ligniaria NRRL 30616]